MYPVTTTLSYAGESGADGVEVLVNRRMLARGPQHYARAALNHGVPILSVHSLLHIRERGINDKITDDSASIRFAAEIPTCEAIVLHPPMAGPRPSAVLNSWLEAISNARAESANPRLRLGLENRGENDDGVEPQYLDDIGRLRRLVEEWDLSITLDTAHAASHGLDVVDAVGMSISKLANVHLSDARTRSYNGGIRNGLFRDHQLPGDGVLPLSDVVTALQKGRYQGPITLEFSPMSLRAFWPPAAKRRMREATECVQSLVANARTSVDRTRPTPRQAAQRREETHGDA